MKTYLFNVQTTVEVEAENESEAYYKLNTDLGEIKDRDVLLVMVTDPTNGHTHGKALKMCYEVHPNSYYVSTTNPNASWNLPK